MSVKRRTFKRGWVKNKTFSVETPPLTAPVKEEKNFNFACRLGICKSEDEFKQFHKGFDDKDIEEERKTTKHCKDCNVPIPFHLLRGFFYKIVESKAFFKLLITGKGTGKSINLAIFQAWYIMAHPKSRTRFVWVYRNDNDRLEKGKDLWNDIIQIHLPDKHDQGILPNFNPRDWKDARGANATGKGVSYKNQLRISFICLAEWDDTSGKFSGDATHYVFEEAMAGNGKYVDDEEGKWGHIFDNVMRVGATPTICWFLANPHTKGIWWLERYSNQEWIDKAFSDDKKKHFFEGDVYMKKINRSVPCLLYQSPAERGEYGYLLDTAHSKTRHQSGTFPEDANKYIQLPMPEKIKQLRYIKDCIWAREVKSGVTEHKQFIYKRREGEKIDSDVTHLCFDVDEFAISECEKEKRVLIDKISEMKYWLKDMLFWGLEMNKNNPLFFTGENETQASQAKNIIMGLIRTNLKSLDRSSRG